MSAATELDLVLSDRVLRFVVPGVPVPQGSKNAFGGEDNPHTKSWRASVADEASKLTRLAELPIAGPVGVRVLFVFPRPKAHYRTGRSAHLLRDAAPYWHVSKPDLDKLQRAIGDALTGVVLRDDSQIARWVVRKQYGSQPRALIEIEQLERPTTVEAIA